MPPGNWYFAVKSYNGYGTSTNYSNVVGGGF
jgi:hypothetical protein